MIRAAEPDGEFGIANASHQVGWPHRALQQHGGAAQHLIAAIGPSNGPAFARLSTSASISVPGRPSRSSRAMCRVTSVTKVRCSAARSANRSASSETRRVGPYRDRSTARRSPRKSPPTACRRRPLARAAAAPEHDAEFLVAGLTAHRSHDRTRIRFLPTAPACRSRPCSSLAADVAGSPIMPARCRTSGSTPVAAEMQRMTAAPSAAERPHDRIEACRHHLGRAALVAQVTQNSRQLRVHAGSGRPLAWRCHAMRLLCERGLKAKPSARAVAAAFRRSKRQAAQPQRIADHRDGTERHGSAAMIGLSRMPTAG